MSIFPLRILILYIGLLLLFQGVYIAWMLCDMLFVVVI